MADDPLKLKGKKGKGKLSPTIILVSLGGAGLVYYLYTRYKANTAASATGTTPAATGTAPASTGAVDPLTGSPYSPGVGSLAPGYTEPGGTTTTTTPTPVATLTAWEQQAVDYLTSSAGGGLSPEDAFTTVSDYLNGEAIPTTAGAQGLASFLATQGLSIFPTGITPPNITVANQTNNTSTGGGTTSVTNASGIVTNPTGGTDAAAVTAVIKAENALAQELANGNTAGIAQAQKNLAGAQAAVTARTAAAAAAGTNAPANTVTPAAQIVAAVKTAVAKVVTPAPKVVATATPKNAVEPVATPAAPPVVKAASQKTSAAKVAVKVPVQVKNATAK